MTHYTITLTYDTDAETPEQAAEEFLGWSDQLTAADVAQFVEATS